MKKIITILCLFLVCFSFAFAEDSQKEFDDKIKDFFRRDNTVFENELKEYYRDPALGQFGLGISLGTVNFILKPIELETGSPIFDYEYRSNFNVAANLSYTLNNLNKPFGFRWNFYIGSTPQLKSLHLGTDFNWIFLKFRFDDSHTRTTHVLDLSLGAGLNTDLIFTQKAYLIDPFGQFGIAFSFHNHWTLFSQTGVGCNILAGSGAEGYKRTGFYMISRFGIRYNF